VRRDADTVHAGNIDPHFVKEDMTVNLPDSVKARVFRGVITASSLVALAIAAGAGRKFS
jgi:hypothetical protein